MEEPKDVQTLVIILFAGTGIALTIALLIAMFAFRKPVPNDALNLKYSTAHQRAMQIERQAMKEVEK